MKIHLKYEKKYLEDFLDTMIVLKPAFGLKIKRIGDLCILISKELGFFDDDLLFAAYYANVGFLSLDDYLDNFMGSEDRKLELIKQHVYMGVDFCLRKGLTQSSKVVQEHHELPNGEGYFNKINKNKNSSALQIADNFIGMVTSNKNRPALLIQYSIAEVLKHYRNSNVFNKEELKEIEKILFDFYIKFMDLRVFSKDFNQN